MPHNPTLESVHQPVIERPAWSLDLAAGPGGLPYAEQQRLAAWFDRIGLSPGDRVSLDDPSYDSATREVIAALAARRGADVGGPAAASPEPLYPGSVRVTVSRSLAHVPGCPDWSDRSDSNLANATHSNFGCAVNANLAAMIADPEHLVHGATGLAEAGAFTGRRAIESYRKTPPTGEKGLKEVSSAGGPGQ
jgi:pilus assembly protein CpaD